jgi:hypothetical protein
VNTPRRITPRHLGAAAVVYGVFVAGWYLGQPLAPECRVDRAALDRFAEEHGTEPSDAPAATPTASPSPDATWSPLPSGAKPEPSPYGSSGDTARPVVTIDFHAVACTNDTGERPRLRAWFEGDWR